jgi:uncharacterized protein (DUF2236 family)
MTDSSVITREQVLGTERRWRRFGEPTPAGGSTKEDGSPDYGLFGPGSVAWEILLHPTTVVFLNTAQTLMQTRGYKGIVAGLRDRDPVSRKGIDGTATFYDFLERLSRNLGMHGPMWFGDTSTAERMAKHLAQYHKKVFGNIIDVGQPELGGYSATSPRETMWAALTELHPALWVYEAFAFRNGRLPHRLTPEQRDQFVTESAAYLRLVGADEQDIPTTMAQLQALYAKYEPLFAPSKTADIMPETGQRYYRTTLRTMIKNMNLSQRHAFIPTFVQIMLLELPVMGAMSGKARWSMGVSPAHAVMSLAAKHVALPLMWVMQQPRVERRFLRLMWGPDGTKLIESARTLHQEATSQNGHGMAGRPNGLP